MYNMHQGVVFRKQMEWLALPVLALKVQYTEKLQSWTKGLISLYVCYLYCKKGNEKKKKKNLYYFSS